MTRDRADRLEPVVVRIAEKDVRYLIREADERNCSVSTLVRLIVESAIRTAEEANTGIYF